MSLSGCVQCGKNIQDFVMIPSSPVPGTTQEQSQSNYAPPSNYEKDSKIWEFISQPRDSKALCERCNELVVSRLDGLIKEARDEHLKYVEFVTELTTNAYPANEVQMPPCSTPSSEQLLKELQDILGLQAIVDTELSTLHLAQQKLHEEEHMYWLELNELGKHVCTITHEWPSTPPIQEEEGGAILAELERLGGSVHNKATANKVHADAFQISAQQGIGIINNLRLGRLPDVVVDWDEINAAWGQTALLLYTLAKKLSFSFTQYRIIPMGFRPTVQHKDTRASYPLYGSNTVTFGRSSFFWSSPNYSDLDAGMEAFLLCVSELCARVLSLSSTIALPYYIDKDKIGTRQGGMRSIRITGNSEQDWSKALKYMLTNLKRILTSLPSLVHESGGRSISHSSNR